MDGGAWLAAVHGVTKSRTQLHFHFHFSLSCIGEGNGNPLQRSCLENPRDGGAWWAAIYGVAQSRTRLKRLSSSSMSPLWTLTVQSAWDLSLKLVHRLLVSRLWKWRWSWQDKFPKHRESAMTPELWVHISFLLVEWSFRNPIPSPLPDWLWTKQT